MRYEVKKQERKWEKGRVEGKENKDMK